MTLVTGGARFIDSNFVPDLVKETDEPVINLNKLTYTGNLNNLSPVKDDICHLSVQGISVTLPKCWRWWQSISQARLPTLLPKVMSTTRSTPPSVCLKRHAVSGRWSRKTSTRHFASCICRPTGCTIRSARTIRRSAKPQRMHRTVRIPPATQRVIIWCGRVTIRMALPVLTTNCSNNNGPYQFPKKLIPLMIVNALAARPLPVSGDGQKLRRRLYVKDHCGEIHGVLEAGDIGEIYNIGGLNEMTNLDVMNTLCAILDDLRPRSDGSRYAQQIAFVKDCPGHDRCYVVDATKIARELGWKSAETFEKGIRKGAQGYRQNQGWVTDVQSGAYCEWLSKNYMR